MLRTHQLLVVIAVLFVALIAMMKKQDNLIDDNARLVSNQEALSDSIRFYKTESDESAASVLQLSLRNIEIKRQYEDLVRHVDNLNIRLRRVQQISRSATETRLEIDTTAKDSIVYVCNTIPDTMRIFRWSDDWVRVSGSIMADSIKLNVVSVDTLIQVVHRVPKKFLFFRYGTKAIRQEIVSLNPHTRLFYTEYIKIK